MERNISWVKAAKRDFEDFPDTVQIQVLRGLEIAAAGQMADFAKPMKGLGAGVFEIRVSFHTDAYRTIYAVKLGDDVYVLHAFQKRSWTGIKTPQKEIDLIKRRLKQLKDQLR